MQTRPRLITALCVVLAVIGVPSAAGAVVGAASTPTPLRAWGVTSNVLFLASIVGLWRMKRWGPLLFLALGLVNLFLIFAVQISDTPPGARSWLALLMPVVYAAVVIPQWKRLGA